MLQRATKNVSETLRYYWSVYKTDQILRLYAKQKYEKIPRKLRSFKQYEFVKINEYGLLFFMVSEENTGAMNKLLATVNYKEKILNDTENPSKISASTFAILNGLPDMALFLKSIGANIFAPNEEGNTLLHIASFHNNLEAVKFAL